MGTVSADELHSAILGALVDSFALNRPSLVEEVIFEWDGAGPPPEKADVHRAIDDLLRRTWLGATEESDDGRRYTVIRLTDEGKAEWRRRNPLEERLEKAWVAQGDVIYAPSEDIADSAARFLYEEIGSADVDLTVKNVEPWTYELDDTGDVINGVRVEFPAIRRGRRLWSELRAALFALRVLVSPRGRLGRSRR